MSNVYERLQKARIELQKADLKKSGHNKFAGYHYFELADFLPTIQNIFASHGLFGHISFNTDLACLYIRAWDKPEEVIQFVSPMSTASLKGCHDIQNLGAVETYLRRYLWVNAMEIVEHDALDATTGKDEPKKDERKLAAFTPEELAEEKELAKTTLRTDGNGKLIITLDPDTDFDGWLNEVKGATEVQLTFCTTTEAVMKLFNYNKIIFDRIKRERPEFFKEMMVKFTEATNKLKEK